jgi:sporulation protein YlmC with PRC-barrel domain
MRIKKISEVVGTRVYTDTGELFGEIEEANLHENKVDGWRMRVGGSIMSVIGGARGVIVPHHFIKAISDIVIVNKTVIPSSDSNFEEAPGEMM